MTTARKAKMKIAKNSIGIIVYNSNVLRFRIPFKILCVLVTLCFYLTGCEYNEYYENYENNVFTTSIPKGAYEERKDFNGFTYSYILTTPDNQQIGIEIIPWFVDLPILMNSYIDYHFPGERQKSSYFNSFNSFNWGMNIGIDCEIYKDNDLLDGWCYAFHTINGESVCVYTYARSGHCQPIERLITDFKIKNLSKPTYSSLLTQSDNMMVSWLRKQYDNSLIYFMPTNLMMRRDYNFQIGGTECGIMIVMNDNMLNNALGIKSCQTIHLNGHLSYISKILMRNYLINLKYPDGTIEVPF